MNHPTRESWLLAAVGHLRLGLFKKHADIPNVRVSVGFPGGKSPKKAIGQYWHPVSCTDAIPQIFISPVLATPLEALDTLVHELVHACTPGEGHGKVFRKLALAVGLEGKMRSASAGTELKERLNTLAFELGEYPHASINLSDRKKQTTRNLKSECPACGYTCRVTRKWLESVGPPVCPADMCRMSDPTGEEGGEDA
jgi:hypothetical protein